MKKKRPSCSIYHYQFYFNIAALAWEQLLQIIKQVAHALYHIHNANQVYGDLKPRNVMLDKVKVLEPPPEKIQMS